MGSHVTMKYKKKIRLLVTNKCSRNCAYCHNEGMTKLPYMHLNPDKLEPFLPDIKKYTNRIVLSGGEPFEYKYLRELTRMLSSYSFDLTLITANIDKTQMTDIGYRLKNVHYSIHKVDNLEADVHAIHWLNDVYPNIRISLNIPFDSIEIISANWERLYRLAVTVGANIQFIRLFSFGSTSLKQWAERWQDMETFLESHAQFLEATEREARYITKELIKIDLLDIPCLSSGVDFSEGVCLNNSDIVIDPELQLSICRWTDSAVSLYENDNRMSFDDIVKQATEKSCKNCIYGKISNYVRLNELDYYLNAPHYTWPRLIDSFKNVYAKTFAYDLSYYGKSGSVSLLENEFSRHIGVKYSLAVNSGTTAVYLACMALGLSVGEEVLIPAMTFPTLVAALLSAGVTVRICDIDPFTGNVSLDSLRSHIGTNVRAVLVTHLWGVPVDMETLREICYEYNVYIIEDCSHAYGAEFQGRKVGFFGDISCFSLQANKAVYAGEGGLLATSNRMFYERAVALSSSVERILDCVKNVDYLKYWGTGMGQKFKINPLGVPFALMSLKNLDEVNRLRKLRISVIEMTLEGNDVFVLPKGCDTQNQRVYYTYKLILQDQYILDRDAILRALVHRGLEASVTSFIPIYKHELCSVPNVINGCEHFPNAEKYYNRIISLPAFTYEPIKLVEYYAETIKEVSQNITHRKGAHSNSYGE